MIGEADGVCVCVCVCAWVWVCNYIVWVCARNMCILRYTFLCELSVFQLLYV